MKNQKGDGSSILLMAVVVLTLATFISYRAGVGHERTVQEYASLQKQQQYDRAEISARTLHDKVIKDIIDAQNKTNLKNAYDHEIALQKVNDDLSAARAESKRLGGLLITIPTPTCKGDYVGAGTQTASTSQRDEKSTTTIALPEPIEAGLWSIVGEADQVTEQLRSCQAWIKDNGFYGK